jgi:uracil-DNA glycosylase family 4
MNPEYEKLVIGIRSCNACSFRDAAIEPLAPSWVQPPVPILFVGENPSWAEDQDVPFAESTISGQALEQNYLQPLGLSREQVWITDLFKCRYPKAVYSAKSKNEKLIQSVAATCACQWLLWEISLANPKVVITLSDKQVYQRMRRAFDLPTPAKFVKAAGRAHAISLDGMQVTLFPMVHPDISRPLGEGDNRKPAARSKWAPIHQHEHIPALKEFLQT